ncbi:MAG: MFS transporter [Sporolactobacillus sp.]
MDYLSPENRGFKKTLIALFLGSFIMYANLYSTQPVIPQIANQFHVSPAIASLSLSAATIALAVCLLFISFSSGLFARKKVMIFALLTSALLAISIGFVHNLFLLIAIRFVQGALLAGYPSIAMAYINEEFDKKCLGTVVGIFISGNSLGGLSGRLIVGFISDHFSWSLAIAGLGLLNLIMCVLFIVFLPKSRHFSVKTMSLRRTMAGFIENAESPALLMLYLLGFVLMGSFVTVYNYVGIPLMQPPYNLSQTLVGFLFIIFLVGTFSSTAMGHVADHAGKANVVAFSLLLMFVGLVTTLAAPLWLKIAGLAIFTFGFFGGHAVASGWVGLLANRREKAQASSLYLLFFYIGSSAVGYAGGLFLQAFGWFGVVAVVGVLSLIGIFIAFATQHLVSIGECHRHHRRTHRVTHRAMSGQHV